MNNIKWSLDDLKSFALARCIDIYEDYDSEEIKSEPPSVQGAWEIGKSLKESENNV